MANLKLYLNNAAAAVTPTIRGTYNDSVPLVTKKCSTAKDGAGAPVSAGVQYGDGTSGHKYVLMQMVSDALGATTYFRAGDAITGVIGILEQNLAADEHMTLHIFVVDAFDAVVGTLLDNYLDSEESSNSYTTCGEDIDAAIIANSVTAAATDRVVIEIGSDINSMTGWSVNGYYGGSGTDLADGGNGTINVGWVNIVMNYNVAPNAPALVSPIGGATIAVGPSQAFSWTFSDDDPLDTQSAYDLRYRVVGAADWTTAPSATVSGAAAQQRAFAANTFVDATDYEWQVRTADALGVYGPYSSSALFTGQAAPGAPAIDDPANGGTVASATYDVDWTIANQAAYQLRTVADVAGAPDTATVYTDTGTVTTAVARTANVAFAVNNRFEHIQLRIYYGALWSVWASIRVAVAYTAPATPTVVVTGSDAGGYISVAPTHLAPTGDQPVVAWIDIWRSENGATAIRIAKEQPPTATFIDWQVASGVAYSYIVRAGGSTGTTADSELTE